VRSLAGRVVLGVLIAAALATALAACGQTRASFGPSTGTPQPITSPVVGRLIDIDAEGLTKVTGFTLRTDAGTEIQFDIGVLENGAEFPPGHLAEHMANASPVRVFFREENGAFVVYRLEDG
jgi:hypothetical protein